MHNSFNKDLIPGLYNGCMANTVGSLAQFQRSVIIGSLLGDGHLRTFPGRSDALMEINHSFKQKEYVDWKYSVLADVSASPPKARNGNQGRIAYRFHSKQLPELTGLHKLFYGNGKKAIPDGLTLDPVMLAVWYMDDGSKCGKDNYYLNTQQYSLSNQERLKEMLRGMGLESALNNDKIYWRIRFLASSIQRFKEIILPHVIPSMLYKLGYNPVETLPLIGQEHRF
jgi:LAGLIDADG DNA endonuclease family